MIRVLAIALILIGFASADDDLNDIFRSEEPPLLEVLRGDKPKEFLHDDKTIIELRNHLSNINSRMRVELTDLGDDGTLFRVWIDPPKKPSFEATTFEGLSDFAEVVDVPCNEVSLWLTAYGVGDKRDLQIMVGFRRSKRNNGILSEFRLPKSHSGQQNKFPHLRLMCSKIHLKDGNSVEVLSTHLALMESTNTKKQHSEDNQSTPNELEGEQAAPRNR